MISGCIPYVINTGQNKSNINLWSFFSQFQYLWSTEIINIVTLETSWIWMGSSLEPRLCSPEWHGDSRPKREIKIKWIDKILFFIFKEFVRLKTLTRQRSGQQWEPSSGWSEILRRSGNHWGAVSKVKALKTWHLLFKQIRQMCVWKTDELPEERPARAKNQRWHSVRSQSCCRSSVV